MLSPDSLSDFVLADGLRIEQQREKLALHLVTRWDRRNAFQDLLARSGPHSIAKHVDQSCPALPVRPVLVRAVNQQRMVKTAFSALQFDGHWTEVCLLLRGQDSLDLVHVARQTSDREKIPSM